MDLIETSRGQVRLSARGLARAGTAGWRYRDRTSRSSDLQGSGPGCDSLRSGGLCGCVRHWCDPLGGRGFRAQSAAQQQSVAQSYGRPGRSTANGAAAGRGRAGIVVALAAALLLGAGYGYLRWISTTQAPAFAGDPVKYGFADTPDIPGAWQFLDLSERWTANINAVRAKDGLPALSNRWCTDREGQDLRQQQSGAGR